MEAEPPLNDPWLIAAWPGMGAVAISACYYLMAKLGMHLLAEFPARECHMDEHAKVLLSVMQVKQRLLEGDFDICRRLADELARWFPGHADYLDSALSHWLCSKKFGAKPLVFRRHLDADFRKVDDHG